MNLIKFLICCFSMFCGCLNVMWTLAGNRHVKNSTLAYNIISKVVDVVVLLISSYGIYAVINYKDMNTMLLFVTVAEVFITFADIEKVNISLFNTAHSKMKQLVEEQN